MIEEALREYLTQHPDRKRARRLKSLWGRWDLLLKEAVHLSHQEKNPLRVLRRGESFERAFRVLPKQIKLMFFFSYQSKLWNRLLKRLISRSEHTFSVAFEVDRELLFYKAHDRVVESLKDSFLPYICREALSDDVSGPVRSLVGEIIKEESLEDRLDAEVGGIKVFNPGRRRAIVLPSEMEVIERGRDLLRVRFFLPSGSYATVMITKALYLPL